MKNIILFIIAFMSVSVSSNAQESEAVLLELDAVILRKESYRKDVQSQIDSLKTVQKKAKGEELVKVYLDLYDCYNNYQVDSALHYLNVLLTLPEVHNDYYKNLLVNMKKAVTFGLMGDFCTAMQIVDTVDVSNAPQDIRCEYFHTCRTVYGWNAEYVRDRNEDETRFSKLTQMYRDSILVYTEPGVRRSIVLADNCIVNGDADAAIDILLGILPKAENEQKIYAYYNLAECYRIKNNVEKYKLYLALTAISDIKNGVTEYTALPELANLMYEEGDISRAYNYLFCSMEDAHFCNAFLRTIEVNNIFPIIDKEYREQEQKNQTVEHSLLTGVSILSVLLIFGLFYLQTQMKRMNVIRKKLAETNGMLADANKQLASANSQLEDANTQLQGFNSQLGENNDLLSKQNDQLAITNKVKEEYIAHYLEMCRSYMDTFENFRKSLLKLAKNNQQTDLMKLLKSEEVMEDEQKRFFADFDKSFLSIHPNFIEEFNALLNDEDRLVPKKGELLNIELRIFALIRLGVDDTAMIAHFLNYSLPTIYNYCSRIRNKSKYDKEEFARRVMEIG